MKERYMLERRKLIRFFKYLIDKGLISEDEWGYPIPYEVVEPYLEDEVQLLPNKDKGTLYEFVYNDFIHESADQTISIHKTHKGAETAMELHKNDVKTKYLKEKAEESNYFGDLGYGEDDDTKSPDDWKWAKYWGINKIKIKE